MATHMGPIILGLGAAFLFLRKKDSSANGNGTNGNGAEAANTGWNVPPGGTSECHLLEGIYATANPKATSPLAAITSAPKLVILSITPEAFKEADLHFHNYFNGLDGQEPDEGAAVLAAELHLTKHLGCPWTKPDDWTPRMHHIHNALVTMFNHPGLYHA